VAKPLAGLDRQDVDAVLFDAGGVLLLPSPDALRDVVAPSGAVPDDERCRWAHYAATRVFDRTGRPDWRMVDAVVATELGVGPEWLDEVVPPIGLVYTDEPWVPVRGAAEALVALQRAGYPLAVVSNASGTMEAQLAEHAICSTNGATSAHVAVVVDSAVVGVEKPDPAIFDFALEALDVAPERCVYVGDTVYFDVNGARAAGLQPVHLDPYGICDVAGHAHARSLDDVVGWLTP
jgi:putative hydrolase of the HAD superfamily